MKTILIISPESWGEHFVSKHHYALELARRGHRVLFLGPPERIKGIILEKIKTRQGDIEIVRSGVVMRGLRFLFPVIKSFIERRWLNALERVAEAKIDCVWSFENSRFYDLSFAGQRLKIYHQVDLNQNFNPLTAAETADIVFCTSNVIRQKLSAVSGKIHKINHGVSDDVLNQFEDGVEQIEAGSAVKAAYVGNLDIPYLDIALFSSIIHSHPDITFLLVGGYDKSNNCYRALNAYPNVIWYGRVSPGKVGKILAGVDITLLVYRADEFRDQLSNPHKLMEYLSSGKVCVATYTDEYADKRNLIQMADSQAEFKRVFNQTVSNIHVENSIEKKNARKSFARENTYSKQFERINLLLIDSGLSPLE
ncbi:glycosyltransferase [Alloalcanivorax gelatiniphagus]|uniref:Glycosyltransferase family 1 protein n=1 Tax=Alloalcanivorax gelatiniphagus TaxID=1194167 RepID=A0ABY2XNQ0_9GAMM|nr:glycosyltransferase [Alloalcanivorax gelatiniphagus]TMW13631.1 glycosyltransferase family 1 protein [Alloalcanivorax gelatiniphagus]